MIEFANSQSVFTVLLREARTLMRLFSAVNLSASGRIFLPVSFLTTSDGKYCLARSCNSSECAMRTISDLMPTPMMFAAEGSDDARDKASFACRSLSSLTVMVLPILTDAYGIPTPLGAIGGNHPLLYQAPASVLVAAPDALYAVTLMRMRPVSGRPVQV